MWFVCSDVCECVEGVGWLFWFFCVFFGDVCVSLLLSFGGGRIGECVCESLVMVKVFGRRGRGEWIFMFEEEGKWCDLWLYFIFLVWFVFFVVFVFGLFERFLSLFVWFFFLLIFFEIIVRFWGCVFGFLFM